MNTQDTLYFSKRERQERDSAARADDTSARCVHLDLARRYRALLCANEVRVIVERV